MLPSYITPQILQSFIASALAEDIGGGDHSTLATVSGVSTAKGHLLVKENGILAGLELAEKIFQQFDPTLGIEFQKKDGDAVAKGDIAFFVFGNAQSILTTERLVLNCMQRMSGIATQARKLCKLMEGTSARLLDSRKTTPNFRMLEKWAVLIGGGLNHRMGLYDMVMVKDNHIELAGGIRAAVDKTMNYFRHTGIKLRVEVEVSNLRQVSELMEMEGVDIVMLDNMSMDDMRSAVLMIDGKYETEASGGITEANIHTVANTGVDFISVGALTHSAAGLDMSLKVTRIQ
jgi:nicotinate-nucleotide pyrophosphorylase (carboxylating)